MSEYISKNVLYKKISELEKIARDRVLNTPEEDPKSVAYELQVAERTAFKHLVADEPAADVRPVVCGEWKLIEYDFFTCSVCGDSYYNGAESTAQAERYLNSGHIYKFCPNCGRDMRGKEKL